MLYLFKVKHLLKVWHFKLNSKITTYLYGISDEEVSRKTGNRSTIIY